MLGTIITIRYEDSIAIINDLLYLALNKVAHIFACILFQASDGVADTPNHSNATWGYPGENRCWLDNKYLVTAGDSSNVFPISTLDTCSDDIAGIDPGLDPVDNYVRRNTKLDAHKVFIV